LIQRAEPHRGLRFTSMIQISPPSVIAMSTPKSSKQAVV
jgi:hypothetical protein